MNIEYFRFEKEIHATVVKEIFKEKDKKQKMLESISKVDIIWITCWKNSLTLFLHYVCWRYFLFHRSTRSLCLLFCSFMLWSSRKELWFAHWSSIRKHFLFDEVNQKWLKNSENSAGGFRRIFHTNVDIGQEAYTLIIFSIQWTFTTDRDLVWFG